jgi:NAD(P)H-flavin reductase/hemoglobin-like flavoprotein
MDTARLRASWAQVAAHGVNVPAFFYARLFLLHPHLREMFPVSMAAQQDRLVSALARVISHVDDLPAVTPFVQQLGRDHRKFQVLPEHFPVVGEALLATLSHFLGEAWTDELAEDWTAAFNVVATVMIEAAEEAEDSCPPWWEADVRHHERRGLDIAVLQIQPRQPYLFRAGQSVSVETSLRTRVWRTYSPANAPRSDGSIELHVKAVPGGQVSSALVNSVQVGDVLRLGAPVGDRLTLDRHTGRDLLLVAGGTGLAPLRAIVEELGESGGAYRISLFVGARTKADLYDLPRLREMARVMPWLTVVPVLSHDAWYGGDRGLVVDAVLRYGRWHDRDVFVCGSEEMVDVTVRRLREAGIPEEQLHSEDYHVDPYRPAVERPMADLGNPRR